MKTIKKREARYHGDKRAFIGVMMESLCPTLDRAMRAQSSFSKLYEDHSLIELWILLKDICVKNGMRRYDILKHNLWNIRQQRRSFDEYIVDFEYQVKILTDGDILSEQDQVNIFLNGLDSERYGTKISDVRSLEDSIYPKTYLEIKDIFSIWINSRFTRGDTGSVYVAAFSKGISCYRCGGSHLMNECNKMASSVICTTCSGQGHMTKCCESVQRMMRNKGAKKKDVDVACFNVGSEDEWIIG
jgi:hypothetical protein